MKCLFSVCFRNVSEVLPEYGIIDVYANPEIYEFDPETMPFSPYKGDRIIRIKVRTRTYILYVALKSCYGTIMVLMLY